MPTRGRAIATSVVALGALYAGLASLPSFRTRGVKNIEERFTAAGGAATHTPAGGSKLGDPHNGNGRQLGNKGAGSPEFKEKIGDQGSKSGPVEAAWNKTMYGQEQGKNSSNKA